MLNSKAAMQIRYFDTVTMLADGPANKVLFIPLN
jgi:hypothetical protein